jgi:hypothetical protein
MLQDEAFDLLKMGKNVFLMGAAGSVSATSLTQKKQFAFEAAA